MADLASGRAFDSALEGILRGGLTGSRANARQGEALKVHTPAVRSTGLTPDTGRRAQEGQPTSGHRVGGAENLHSLD